MGPMQLPKAVTLAEVGPRDGFQHEKKFIDTELKVALIQSLADAGLSFKNAGRSRTVLSTERKNV